jgi:hypothetical protein
MPIVILACGLLFALAGAGLGVLMDLTVWGCLGLSCLAGNLAVIALVAAALWRTARQEAGTDCRAAPVRSLLLDR